MSIQDAIKDSLIQTPTKADANVEDTSGTVEVTPDGGSFANVASKEPLTNWNHIFEQFGLDPDKFRIDGKSVTMKAWQQSKRLENGDRDTVTLYSYGARFVKVDPEAVTLEDLQKFVTQVKSWDIQPNSFYSKGVPVAAVLNLADLQLGKDKDMKGTFKRLERALEGFLAHVDEVRARGVNLNELVIINGGDSFEGVSGNYSNQLHTVEGGLRMQMNAVLDVWLTFCKELFPKFEKRQFVSVLCNHTQFGRQGGAKESITGDEDSGGAFLAETLQRILHATDEFKDVKFVTPHDEMNVYTTAAGVPIGANHGHKIPGSGAQGFEKWLGGIVRAEKQAYETKIWFTAHKHSFQMFDVGSATVFQAPSCDHGSPWLTQRTGTHSNAGVMSVLVGKHHRLNWSDVQFL